MSGFVTWLTHFDSTKAQIFGGVVFIFVLSITGMVGYRLLEGWSLMDGLYMTFITLTTIGFAEVAPLSFGGRIFTIALGTVGIICIGFIVTRITQLLVARQRLRERHIRRMINRLSDHYIICGFGRIGARIASDLWKAGKSFVVIEIDEEKLEHLDGTDYLYIDGNAEQDAVLQRAGIERASGLITTLREDSSNVFVTLLGRELNPSLFIMARSSTTDNVRRLRRAGADKVIAPYEIGADQMARVILKPNVNRFLEKTVRGHSDDLRMDEISVKPGSSLENKTLIEADFRQEYGSIVIGIVSADSDDIIFNPKATTRLQAGDVLIVLGTAEMFERLQASC
ncbi:MAG: potassium channel protein [Bacteroidota bacterium]